MIKTECACRIYAGAIGPGKMMALHSRVYSMVGGANIAVVHDILPEAKRES
jgi:hypothetical protein